MKLWKRLAPLCFQAEGLEPPLCGLVREPYSLRLPESPLIQQSARQVQRQTRLLLQQRQRNRFQVIVFDAYLQLAFAQSRLEALSGLCLAGSTDCLPMLINQDAVSP